MTYINERANEAYAMMRGMPNHFAYAKGNAR